MSQNLRQTIIQTIMSKPYLTMKQLNKIIEPLHTEATEFIAQTNKSLSSLGLELRRIISDYNDVEYCGICEIYEDINGKESLGIKPEIVQLFYKFLDLVINSPKEGESEITVGSLLDLAVDGLTQTAAQEGLTQLKDFGYIEIINDKVRIGPRGILEFRPKFSQKTADGEESGLRTCQICLDFILAGKKCPRCTCCMHKRCYQRYIGDKDPSTCKCPACQCSEGFQDFGM